MGIKVRLHYLIGWGLLERHKNKIKEEQGN